MKSLGSSLPAPLQAVDRVVRRHEWSALRPWYPGAWDRPSLVTHARIRFLMGPANFAEQGYMWSRAIEKVDNASVGIAMRLGEDAYGFRKDYWVPTATTRSLFWTIRQMTWVPSVFSHVFIEACRPIIDPRLGLIATVRFLEKAGVGVGLVVHGSEARLPSQHAEMYEFSPFRVVPEDRREWVTAVEQRVKRNLALLADLENPKYVASPDLVDVVPGAQWAPICVNLPDWHSEHEPLDNPRPKVVFAPTNGWLKGAELVEKALIELHEAGSLQYIRIAGKTHSEASRAIKECDIVVDSLGIGYYATTAIQGMAAGRVVICLVDPQIRKRVPEDLPLVMPDRPSDLRQVIEHLLVDRATAKQIASRGPDFVERWHSGQQSGNVLAGLWRGRPNGVK